MVDYFAGIAVTAVPRRNLVAPTTAKPAHSPGARRSIRRQCNRLALLPMPFNPPDHFHKSSPLVVQSCASHGQTVVSLAPPTAAINCRGYGLARLPVACCQAASRLVQQLAAKPAALVANLPRDCTAVMLLVLCVEAARLIRPPICSIDKDTQQRGCMPAASGLGQFARVRQAIAWSVSWAGRQNAVASISQANSYRAGQPDCAIQ